MIIKTHRYLMYKKEYKFNNNKNNEFIKEINIKFK
jgi:hypothetical protein